MSAFDLDDDSDLSRRSGSGAPVSAPSTSAKRPKPPTRPTVQGATQAWFHQEGPVNSRSLVGRVVAPREWAVDQMIPMKQVTLLSGDGGLGKSTLAMQMAAAVSLGYFWLGFSVPTRAKVAYVSNEDDLDEMQRRLEAICDAEGWDLGSTDIEMFDRTGRESSIMYRGQDWQWEATPFWIGFSNWVRDNQPRVVVFDSLYNFYGSNSQLDQGTAHHFMGLLRELAIDANSAFLVLWHPSKTGLSTGDGTSGNVAFRNASRSMLYLEREKDAEGPNKPLILYDKKGNYRGALEPLRIQWQAGRFTVLGGAPENQQKKVTRDFLSGDTGRAWRCLVDLINSTSERTPGGNYMPAGEPCVAERAWREMFYARKGEADVAAKRKAFRRAYDSLEHRGYIGTWEGTVWMVRRGEE